MIDLLLETVEQVGESQGSLVGSIVGIIVIAVIAVIIAFSVKNKQKEMKEKEAQNEKEIEKLGLNLTKQIKGENYTILFDNDSKKFAIKIEDMEDFKIYKYKDFIECNVVSNSGQENNTNGKGGKVILGYMFLGAVGALAGAAGKKKSKSVELVYSLSVRIMVNDMIKPFYQIDFIEEETKTNSDEYQQALKDIEEIVATFNLVKNNDNKKD